MTLATNFLLSFNPVWSMVDLNGIQANDSFYMWVLTNTIPYIPQAIYFDAGGTIPWGVPIQFLANGTLPINMYWDENLTYRLEIRQNSGLAPPSQSDPLIYLIENYIPLGGGSENTPSGQGVITTNQITNPQFALVNFDKEYDLTNVTNPPSIAVGPGWFLDLVGTGNLTLEQVDLDTTVSTATNAPYVLNINVGGGWTSQPVLRQRFYQNGLNWQNKTLAVSITASINGAPQNIFIRLDASNGQPLMILLTATLGADFVEYKSNVVLGPFVNLDSPPDAYLDFKIFLPTVADIYLTSVQLTESALPVNVEYQQDTINRQIDHTFHYYQPLINYKQIPSYLIGWDFPLNPTQPFGPSVPVQATGANKGFYAWDQTIVYQTTTNSVSVSRGTQGSLQLTAQANGQVALIQYLDSVTARKILTDRASVHISGFTNVAGGLGGNVTLWATTDGALPVVSPGTNNTFITTIGADGIPSTVSSVNWVQVPNLYQNTEFTLQAQSATNSELADINLNGWNLNGAAPSTTATYFAIVVGFAAWVTTDTININSIALCAGEIATRPAPKSPSETLLDCNRFYWSTFPDGVAPVTAYGAGTGYPVWQRLLTATGGTIFTVDYPVDMRANPNVTFYNPVNANAFAYNFSRTEDCTATVVFANTTVNGTKLTTITAADNTSGTLGDVYGVHLSADARLGIV